MSASPDDPWADLYTELEVENAAKAAVPPPLPVESDDEGDEEDDGPEGEDTGAVGEGPPADGEQPKKRRRRRRRRKGGKPGEGEAAVGEAGATEGEEPPAGEADGEAFTEPAGDPSRDVIRTWNVPSWSEIVAGLYRPG